MYDYVEVAQQLETALGSLKSVEQAVLILRYQNNCSRSEIATQIEISKSTVDRYLISALSKLRTQVLTSTKTCEPDADPRATGTDGMGGGGA